MQYTRLGRTALQVSRLCLGTMNFGPRTSEADSHAIMDQALELGINFFDTANRYGAQIEPGHTETIIGRWLAQGGRRERIVLATKVYGPMGDGQNERGLSAYHIRRACDDSLRRLQTDRIDLYQMHHVDRNAPWDEIYQAMEQLVDQGKVIYVGSSNFGGWHIAQAMEQARARHFLGLVSEQSHYNLATRQVELEVLPACRHYGLGVIPWSPLAGGVLAGQTVDDQQARRAADNVKQRFEQLAGPIEQYHALCGELGAAPAEVALAWLLHQPAVTGPIIGPRTAEQLSSAVRALDVTLDEAAVKRLDGIWPGPGGPAPEAYAW